MRILGIVLGSIFVAAIALPLATAVVLWRRARKSRNRVVVVRPELRVVKGGKR